MISLMVILVSYYIPYFSYAQACVYHWCQVTAFYIAEKRLKMFLNVCLCLCLLCIVIKLTNKKMIAMLPIRVNFDLMEFEFLFLQGKSYTPCNTQFYFHTLTF